jgi:hypothetical protein
MDTLRAIPGSRRAEREAHRDHLAVFREFLDHLDRVARQSAPPQPERAGASENGSRKR